MWCRDADGYITYNRGRDNIVNMKEELYQLFGLGDILLIYDKNWKEYYKAEILCIDDEVGSYGVINYEGNDFYSLEPLMLGLIDNVTVTGGVTKEVFMNNVISFE